MVLYAAVTADKYELPLCISPYLREISLYTNISTRRISNAICRRQTGKYKGIKFIKINIDDEE